MEKLPKDLFIVGGGYIGVEIANTLHAFGINISIAMNESHVVCPFDKDITNYYM